MPHSTGSNQGAGRGTPQSNPATASFETDGWEYIDPASASFQLHPFLNGSTPTFQASPPQYIPAQSPPYSYGAQQTFAPSTYPPPNTPLPPLPASSYAVRGPSRPLNAPVNGGMTHLQSPPTSYVNGGTAHLHPPSYRNMAPGHLQPQSPPSVNGGTAHVQPPSQPSLNVAGAALQYTYPAYANGSMGPFAAGATPQNPSWSSPAEFGSWNGGQGGAWGPGAYNGYNNGGQGGNSGPGGYSGYYNGSQSGSH